MGVAAAAVLVFGLGAVAGYSGRSGGPGRGSGYQAIGTAVQVDQLRTGGRSVGKVLVDAGNPTWVFMYMDEPRWSGALYCRVVVDHGPTVTLGRFWLTGGKGAWAASVDQPAGRLRQVQVVGTEGKVLAVADLS
jgi:hypothetical protein